MNHMIRVGARSCPRVSFPCSNVAVAQVLLAAALIPNNCHPHLPVFPCKISSRTTAFLVIVHCLIS